MPQIHLVFQMGRINDQVSRSLWVVICTRRDHNYFICPKPLYCRWGRNKLESKTLCTWYRVHQTKKIVLPRKKVWLPKKQPRCLPAGRQPQSRPPTPRIRVYDAIGIPTLSEILWEQYVPFQPNAHLHINLPPGPRYFTIPLPLHSVGPVNTCRTAESCETEMA